MMKSLMKKPFVQMVNMRCLLSVGSQVDAQGAAERAVQNTEARVREEEEHLGPILGPILDRLNV